MDMEKQKRTTIYDVARKAGVSITTVSRYLNNPDSVKESTGEKIADVVEELDYIPQGNTGTKASRNIGRIGVLTPFFPAPSFVERLRGIIAPLKEKNYEVVIYTIETPDQLEEYLNSVPFTRRIDGLILMSVHLTPGQHRLLRASELHVVMIESDDEGFSRVLADDRQGGRLAGQLFIAENYFPCAFMGDKNQALSYSCHPSETRLEGFQETLGNAKKVIDESMILESDTTVEDAETVFGTLLDKGITPRGIFAMCDLQAIGIFNAANKRNIRIPEELAILGFDDIDAAGWMGISTISQHLAESGRIAASLLLDLISGNRSTIQNVKLQVELVRRDTG